MIPAQPAYPLAQVLLSQALSRERGQEMLTNPPPLEYLESRRLGGGPAFYLYGTHFLCGHKKSGKSWLTMMQALDHIDDGLPVVVLDFENGAPRFVRRLGELGVRSWPEALTYIPHPQLPPAAPEWDALVMELGDLLPGALVVIDSYRSLTGHYGFEVTDPNGVERLMRPFVRTESLTTVALDHSRMSTKRGQKDVAAWNAAKQQLADAVYYAEKTEDYSVERCGELVLEIVDDRDGRLRPLRAWDIGGQGEGAPLFFSAKDAPAPAKRAAAEPAI